MCTHIGIIHKGEIQFEGTMEELSNRGEGCNILVETSDLNNYIEIIKKQYPQAFIENENQFKVPLKGKEEIPAFSKFMVTKDIPLYELKIVEGLEESFLSLTK
jgi:ABC-2 type transport system ATP-binding protein